MSFYDAFSRFVVLWRNHQTPRAQLERDAMNVDIPPCLYTTAYALWAKTVTQWTRFMHSHKAEMKRVKLFLRDLTQHSFTAERKTGRVFTVCMRSYKQIHVTQWWLFYAAHRVAQIRVVFTISSEALAILFGHREHPPQHLAYVEWFTPFKANPEPNSKLYKVARSLQGQYRVASIVPVTNVVQSVHMSPLPGAAIPRDWNSHNILDKCRSFLVNSFCDYGHSYQVFHELE